MNHEMKPIDNLKDIPADLSDEEQIKFLETHGVSEEFLEKAEDAWEDERPRPRTRPINVRFDDFTLNRLKQMAERRNVGYQTLLKSFVLERLYEEEKREGALLTGQDQEQRISDERETRNAETG
jgi:predicted DNA binding CopG/RHH family protein